jgi:Ca2+-binding RTX toxin-like protein
MAYIYVNSNAFINMLNPQTWYGNVINHTSTNITITDGYNTASYSGFGFVYSGSTVVGGTLTGYPQYYLGSLLGSASGLSVSASLAASYIQSNNIPALLSIALSGNDTLDLANGDDTAVSYGGNDIISAGDGNDDIWGGVGADWIDGGSGFDYARYDSSSSGVYIRLDTRQGYSGEANGDGLVSIEGLVGSADCRFALHAPSHAPRVPGQWPTAHSSGKGPVPRTTRRSSLGSGPPHVRTSPQRRTSI